MRTVQTITLLLGILLWGGAVSAADLWISKREAVAEGELYLQSAGYPWQTMCIRQEDDRDNCFAIAEVQGAIPVAVSLVSYAIDKGAVKADVDVAAVGKLIINSIATARLDKALYVAIDSLDGVPFDGYLCKLADESDCLREADLDKASWSQLLKAGTVQLSFFRKIPRKRSKDAAQAGEDFRIYP